MNKNWKKNAKQTRRKIAVNEENKHLHPLRPLSNIAQKNKRLSNGN